MKPWAVLLLSALSGYFALSQEIVWVHALSYASGGEPRIFAQVLGAFLVGIAAGSLFVERRAQRPGFDGRALLPLVFLASGVLSWAALPVLARLFSSGFSPYAMKAAYVFVLLLACTGGAAFPLLCHLGIRGDARVGASLSLIYFANIVGSVLGPLFTTFVLMDRLSLAELALAISLGTTGTALLALRLARPGRRPSLAIAAGAAAFAALALAGGRPAYGLLLERLQFRQELDAARPFRRVIETRSGVVALGSDAERTIYGGGMYDGKLNVDPVHDTNAIARGYLMAALHPQPRRVLEIGLSGGSWARVIAAHPEVTSLEVVEINPGYLDLIRGEPDQAPLLEDPKVVVHVDDGRRWLVRHPERKFDFILMNTTQHWRSQVTNLLSREFLALCRAHLAPGGVLYYNSTFSEDVVATAASVFPHVVRYQNFVAASDAPFALSPAQRRANLQRFAMSGRPVFDEADPASRAVLDALAAEPLEDLGPAMRARADRWIITDDNMATEFRRSRTPTPRRDVVPRILGRLAALLPERAR